MGFQLKHITSHIILRGFIIILMVLLFLLLVLYSSVIKEEKTEVVRLLESTISENRLENKFDNAMLLFPRDEDFVDKTSKEIIEQHKVQISSIIDSLSALKDIRFLKRYFKKNPEIDSLISEFNLYATHYESAILTLKTLGNSNGGIIKNISSQIRKVEIEIALAPDSDILQHEFDRVAQAFITQIDQGSLRELQSFCSDIQYEIISTDAFDSDLLQEETTHLKNMLDDAQRQFDLIYGSDEYAGHISVLSRSNDTIKELSRKAIGSVTIQSNRFTLKWNILLISFASIVLIITSLLLINIARLIRQQLHAIIQSGSELEAGNIDTEISTSGKLEFHTIIEQLNHIRGNLLNHKDFIDNLLNSDFEFQYTLSGKKDSIGKKLVALKEQLLEAKNKQEGFNKENEIRRYINEGLAKFSNIMRMHSNDTNALGDNLIRELVKYLGIEQGGIFLTDENESNTLKLISSFAYDRKKYLQKTIKFGDGLVGTCALEKKTINLTEVPKDYIAIKSGLGDTPPSNILIIPVMNEEVLVGIIELAALKKFQPHQINLSEEIASSLATSILAVRNNATTAELLKKSQQQAAEMAEQEEEMRQNMEELKATQEESARREEELQGILSAIETSFYLIEYELTGEIRQINSKLEKFLEQSSEHILGRKHRDIFSDKSKIDDKVIEEIKNSSTAKTISEQLPWGSRELIYKHTLSPIKNSNGDIIKILNLLIIEETK